MGIGLSSLVLVGVLAALPAPPPSSSARLAALEKLMPETPRGHGRPGNDRAFWTAQAAEYPEVVARAEKLLKEPLPSVPDELYLEYSRNGNRTNYQNAEGARRGRLTWLVLAELLEWKGRFIPATEELVESLSKERSWLLPAHDGNLNNFSGKQIDIDLVSARLGHELALAHWLLGDKLSPATRTLIRSQVERRVLDPFRKMARGERPRNWWMDTTNNWNSVCLAGVVGAGLALSESKADRAFIVESAERFAPNFLAGFTPDGYCSEGIGYWNYGFNHFLQLAEILAETTGGKVDLMARKDAVAPSLYGRRILLTETVGPAYADCAVTAQPDRSMRAYLDYRFGRTPTRPKSIVWGSLAENLMYRHAQTPILSATAKDDPLRSWFAQAGVYVGRPTKPDPNAFAVSWKGGNNDEHHNHNDLGSFVVSYKGVPVLLDPGLETYTARTFSNKRYDSKLLNSYGHSVPVIGGQLQRTGAAAKAKVVSTKFSADEDRIEYDITSAYVVPGLKSYKRTFVFSRTGAGMLTVLDTAVFERPLEFETALMTLGTWAERNGPSFVVESKGVRLRVEVASSDATVGFGIEKIEDTVPTQPTRIKVRLAQPVSKVSLRTTITPAP